MSKYFIYAEYSFIQYFESVPLYECYGRKIPLPAKAKEKKGYITEVVEIPDLPADKMNEWLENWQDEKGKQIVEADIEHRDNVYITIKNMSKL